MAPIKILARQARSIKLCKNLRTKGMKCCANVYFNRKCVIKDVTLKLCKNKYPYTSPTTNIPQKKVQTIRLKEEIKFLYIYMKKEKLNNKIHRIHLKAAQERGEYMKIQN